MYNHNKKIILFVCHDFPPYRYAGAQLYAKKLAQKMNCMNTAKVDIFYPVFREHYQALYTIKETDRDGLRVFELRKEPSSEPGKVFNEKVAYAFSNFLKQHPYDCIHFHGLGQLSLAPVFVAHRLGIKTLITLHDYWFLCDRWHMIRHDQRICCGPETIEKCVQCFLEDNEIEPNRKNREMITQYKKYRREYCAEAFQYFDKAYAPSRYLGSVFQKYGYDGIETNPLGFEYDELPARKKRADRTLVFGYAGQIIPRKGVNYLIEAFRNISQQNICLHIWGKIDPNTSYGSLIKHMADADERIRLFGEYKPEQLQYIFSTFDVAVIPSLMENYPMIVQEAFIHKVPVIATRAGGIPEAVIHGRNGLLVKPGSADEIQSAIETLIAKPALVAELSGNIPPAKKLSEDAAFYVKTYKDLLSNPAPVRQPKTSETLSSKDALTVQFYVFRNVHWPMFENLYYYLKDRDEIKELVICLPDLPKLIGFENYAFVERLLALDATLVTDPRTKEVDVTFIADTLAGKVQGCGRIVNVGHGTISKGLYFTDGIWTEQENWVDLLCVPGSYAKDQFENVLHTRVAATGMPKLDKVFSGHYNRDYLCALLNINPDKKIILYVPTFNTDLSSVYDFQSRFAELCTPNRTILIKLHASTLGATARHYRKLAEKHRDIIFIDDFDITPYIGGADIMISDGSSAFMEFMALDKPVILYNNRNRHNYHDYNPEDIEYTWRDLGTQVDSFDELKHTLENVIHTGDDKSGSRTSYAKRLFADLEGHASERVWQETLQVLKTDSTSPLPPVFSAVLLLKRDNLFAVRASIYDLQLHAVMPMELVIVVQGQSAEICDFIENLQRTHQFKNIVIVSVDEDKTEDQAGLIGMQHAQGDVVLYMKDNVVVYTNFDYVIHKTFQAHHQVAALTGITTLPNNQINVLTYLPQPHSTTADKLAYECINRFQAAAVAPVRLSCLPPLIAFKRTSIDNKVFSDSDYFQHILMYEIRVCLSLFYSAVSDEDITVMKNFWQHRHRMPAAQRIECARTILESYTFPDIAEQLVDDLLEIQTPKRELLSLVSKSIQMRFYDTAYKHKIIKTFSEFPELAEKMHKEVTILEQLTRKVPLGKSSTPRSIKPGTAPEKRVLLYFFKNVHIPILMPIYRQLKAFNPGIKIAFGYLPYAPRIRAGFTPDELQSIAAYGEDLYAVPQEFKPDLTFIADSVYPWTKNCGKLVHVGHGVLSKGQYYTDTATARREQEADLVCVPGAYHAKIMQQITSRPVTATGMAKLDPVFSGALNRRTVIRQFDLPQNHYRYILFAPTFNDELSSIPFVEDRINEVIPDDKTLLLIKLHGSTKEEYKQVYRRLVDKDPRVIFVDELDITPFLSLADVMISDVSSAMMEFAALDKPVVLFNNPNWKTYENFNPVDIEFTWRDIGMQVGSLCEMKDAIKHSLAHPEECAAKRKHYTDQLFANKYDGQAAERIVAQAVALLDQQPSIKRVA